jgi:hypothetical protein
MPRGGIVPPAPVLAPGSALGSRPRVALSSAQVPTVYRGPRPPGNAGAGSAARTTGQETPPGTAGQDQENVPGSSPRGGLLTRCGVGLMPLYSHHIIGSLLEGGLSAPGSRTSEATDLSCHLSQVVFAPLRGAPSVVSRGTDRGARSNLPYGQFGDRASGTIRSR